MYGYLKYFNSNRRSNSWRRYKCYYCGLCNALKKNYGPMAPLFLSNDVTFICIVLSNPENVVPSLKPKCCLTRKCKKIRNEYGNKFWTSMATFSLALVYAKAYDNCLDTGGIAGIISRIQFFWIGALTRTAKKKNGSLFSFFQEGMNHLRVEELKGCHIMQQGELFAEIIMTALCSYLSVNVSTTQEKLITAILKWLCFIDAIDDYNGDIKSEHSNPLFYQYAGNGVVIKGQGENSGIYPDYCPSWGEVFDMHYSSFAETYYGILLEMEVAVSEIQTTVADSRIIQEMISSVMPEKLFAVMKKRI